MKALELLMVKLKFSKTEILHLVIALFIVAFVFGFNDGRDIFELNFWFINFIKIIIFSAIAIFVHIFSQKLVAKYYGFSCEFRLWAIRQWRFIPVPKFPKKWKLFGLNIDLGGLPIGAILAVLITLLSNGLFYFIAIGNYLITSSKSTRIGRKWVYISDSEEAKIATVGAMSNIFLMLILKIVNFQNIFDDLIFINGLYALFSLIPIPPLDGAKLFISNRVLYIFTLVFVICTVALISYLSSLLILIIALILGAVMGIIYFYFFLYKIR